MERMITIHCEGETTKQLYDGVFHVKLFLSHRELASVKREANAKTFGLSSTPKWRVDYLLQGLKDELAGIKDNEKLNLSKEQIDRIFSMVLISCPLGDPEADAMTMIAELNGHILKAPTWWGRKDGELGGYDLVDCAPIVELKRQLDALQRDATKKPEPAEQ
jgi:hypothetical protein